VIIVNALRKILIVAASFVALGVFNSAMAELVYKPLEQPVEAPNPNLKIEAVNEKFAAKYPKQFETWKATEKGEKLVYADEENPRLIVLWGGMRLRKNITHHVVTFMRLKIYAIFCVLVHRKRLTMAHNQWRVGRVKVRMCHV
jgi:cytochrome c-552